MSRAAIEAIKSHPDAVKYMSFAARVRALKYAPADRATVEARLARAIRTVENSFYRELEESDGVPATDFWERYKAALIIAITSPIRAQIETTLAQRDMADIIDRADAASAIDAQITETVTRVAENIADKTRAEYEKLALAGIAGAILLERLAFRFSDGHADQIAITELTRADSMFASELSKRLEGYGIQNQIRWLTAEDELVCPVCAPADHKLRDEKINTSRGGWNGQTWGERFHSPPAHPNCRCQTIVEVKR